MLNSDQNFAFQQVQSGKNIFLTGPAGSGKSFLIKHIVDWAMQSGKIISVTAMTGCAALLLGPTAKTLHSWAGIGLGKDSADALCTSIIKNPKNKRKWKKTEILIIDEISMMTPCLFEKLDIIGKRVRSSTKPWGSLQLILCGDFFQLPPVSRGSGISGELSTGRFAFESPAWAACSLKNVILSKIERQTDVAFQTLLNECRIGTPSIASIELMKSRQGLDWKKQLIKPTLLFSRNADVDAINEKNIQALNKPIRVFTARTSVEKPADDPTLDVPCGEIFERYVTKLDSDASYCPTLELCVGAQVMLLVNKDVEAGLVNGSRGVIVEFRGDGVPIVQFKQGDPVAIERQRWTSADCLAIHRDQIPLRVAYAISIHKSQGATLDCALVDIGTTIFEYGQAYVALSRVRNLESLYIFNLDATKIMAHPTVLQYYEQIMEANSDSMSDDSEQDTTSTAIVDAVQDEDWRPILQNWLSRTGLKCLAQIEERKQVVKVFPEKDDIFAALSLPLHKVKVVILGQDPYHGQGQAHGLSFSVKPGVPIPPSLRNIRKELINDLALGEQIWPASVGTLTPWLHQGVLLLNSILTVEEGNPMSHAALGWEDLTTLLLGSILCAHMDDPLVFVGWGKSAQNVLSKLKLGPKHLLLSAAHPSPLSAHAGFFGSKPFSKTNAHLVEHGKEPIVWKLSQTVSEDPV